MSQQYTLAINELYKSLGLDAPTEVEEVTSLQVGEMVCHITEQPADCLLMFANVGLLDSFDTKQVLEQNMFSQELFKPVLGYDDASQCAILWSRQSLLRADGQSSYQQLEQLSQASDNLSQRQEHHTEVQVSDDFNPGGFRV